MTNRKMVSEIEKRMKAIGKERDRLDNLISEIESLREDCAEAWDNLQDARDALSRQV